MLPPLSARAASIYKSFVDPPTALGPLPQWFWNGNLDEGELLRQLDQFKVAGCAGAIIYPRHGLRTPYLSPEWMRLVGTVAQHGRDLGLQIWLADSENSPGGVGPAAGEAWYLKISRFDATGASDQIFDAAGLALAACALVHRSDGSGPDFGRLVDLSSAVSEGKFQWTPPDGLQWEVFLFKAVSYPHSDLLADGSGERLLQSTHARYEDALGSLSDAGITGFFSDDVAPVSVWNVPDPQALPWTAALIEELASRTGSLLKALLPLAIDMPGAPRARQQFWQMVADRYEAQFFRPIREWLDSRGLQWAGHLLFEEPLLAQVPAQADFPRILRSFSLPVVDNLLLRPAGIESNLAASAAHHAGAPAAVESFGGAGWGFDLAAARRSFDMQAVRGIDRLIPHGVFYSMSGKRKLENTPSGFLREPFAGAYPLFSDHVRRLGWAMSEGKAIPRVALLYPLRSAWASLVFTEASPLAQAIEEDFRRVSALLEEAQYEYEIVDEQDLLAAEVVADRLRLEPVDFPILVIPSCPYISRAAWKRVEEFLENGGKILCLGMLPEGFEDGPDPELQAELMRLAAVEVDVVRYAYLMRERNPAAGQQVYTYTYKNAAGGRFSAFQAGLSTDADFARGEVRQILNSYFPPDVECRSPSVRYRRRALGGLDLYWVVSTAEKPIEVRLALRGHGAPELWNPTTGAREPIFQYTWVGIDQTVVTLRLNPSEGALLALPAQEAEHLEAANFVVEAVQPTAFGVEVIGYDDPLGTVKVAESLVGPPQAIWKRGRESLILQAPSKPPIPSLNLDRSWSFTRLHPNVLVLEEWRYRRDERGGGRILGWHRRLHLDWDELPERQPIAWFPKLEPLESKISAYTWYQSSFTVGEWQADQPLWLALETIDAPVRCWVDGVEREPALWQVSESEKAGRGSGIPVDQQAPSLDDPEIHWVDLSAGIATGHHSVTLLADYRQAHPIQPDNRHRIPIDLVPGRARLVGDFAVQDRARGRVITIREGVTGRAGPWTEQGYPHYSGCGIYRRTLFTPEDYAGTRLFLEIGGASSTVQIAIDGKDAGRAAWPPFYFDVTEYLVPGMASELQITVCNTSANAVIGQAVPSGILGSIRLHAFPLVRLRSE